MKYIFYLVFAMLSTYTFCQQNFNILHGTTILSIVTPDTIWMAADSKIVDIRGKSPTYSKGKKLFNSGTLIYGFAAILSCSTNKGAIYFDPHSLMKRILKNKKGIANSFKDFKESISIELNKLLDTLITNRFYDKINKYTKEPLHTFLMAKFENGKPYFFSQSYLIVKTATGYKIQEQKEDIYDYGNMIFMVGSKDSLKFFLNKNPTYLAGFKNIKEKLICLISIEAKANPHDVGMPVTGVTLTKNKVQWSFKNRICTIE